VAKLAGVPENVLKRAKEIVKELSENDIADKAQKIAQKAVRVENGGKQERKEPERLLRDEEGREGFEASEKEEGREAGREVLGEAEREGCIKAEGEAAGKAEKNDAKEEKRGRRKKKKEEMGQISLFDLEGEGFHSSEDIIMELREMNLNTMTPIKALNMLYELQEKVKERW
jgi:DNA mismatch repair protein MutS